MKLIISIFLVSSSVLSLAQTKINGIGEFKIGITTTSLIEHFSTQYNTPINETNNVLETETNYYDETPTKILYLSKEKNENVEFAHSRYIRHPKVKVYFLNNYLIPEVVVLHNIFLRFYNDTLYSFECEGSDILDTALTLKYGNPKIYEYSKNVVCGNAYRTFNYKESTFTKEWLNPAKKIRASLTYSTFYNDKCEKQFLTYFLIENEVIDKKIEDQVEKNERLKQSSYETGKKQTLTNF